MNSQGRTQQTPDLHYICAIYKVWQPYLGNTSFTEARLRHLSEFHREQALSALLEMMVFVKNRIS